MLVAARGAGQQEGGHRQVEGRKSYLELNPEAVALAKRLHRYAKGTTHWKHTPQSLANSRLRMAAPVTGAAATTAT